jgi:VPS inhibitor protein D
MPLQRKLKRQLYSITKVDDGYMLNAPKHRGLVLSGGGAKGIGYVGMLQALYESESIQQFTHISGASSGALSASFIAAGMSPKNYTCLALELDLPKLLDNEGFGVRAAGNRLRNILEIIYMLQIKEHMEGMPEFKSEVDLKNYSILKHKIQLYESVLKQKNLSITSFQDVIKLSKNRAQLRLLDQAFKLLPEEIVGLQGKKIETPRITFGDLERLKSILPLDKQHIIKKLSVVTTNQTRRKLETFNVDNGNGDQSIAAIVQQSGAHPALFAPAKNAHGDSIADGGILDNMPIEALLELGLNIEEILCVKIEAEDSYQSRVKNAHIHTLEHATRISSAMDSVAGMLIGGRFLQGRAAVLNREKILIHIGNMLYINAGTLTATTKNPTYTQKHLVLNNAYQSTKELLRNHNKIFDAPLLAMLYLGADNLDQLLILENGEQEIDEAAFQAKRIFFLQKHCVEELNAGNFDYIEDYIQQIQNTLRINTVVQPLNEKQQKLAMSLCLKQIDYFTEGKLEKYIHEQIAIAKQQGTPKVSWFRQLLAILYIPIEWVISLFSCSNPKNPVAEELSVEENEELSKEKITPLKLLSMFSYAAPQEKKESTADQVKKEIAEKNKSGPTSQLS